MLPDRLSNPGPLSYESGALPIALRGLATNDIRFICYSSSYDVILMSMSCHRLNILPRYKAYQFVIRSCYGNRSMASHLKLEKSMAL